MFLPQDLCTCHFLHLPALSVSFTLFVCLTPILFRSWLNCLFLGEALPDPPGAASPLRILQATSTFPSKHFSEFVIIICMVISSVSTPQTHPLHGPKTMSRMWTKAQPQKCPAGQGAEIWDVLDPRGCQRVWGVGTLGCARSPWKG